MSGVGQLHSYLLSSASTTGRRAWSERADARCGHRTEDNKVSYCYLDPNKQDPNSVWAVWEPSGRPSSGKDRSGRRDDPKKEFTCRVFHLHIKSLHRRSVESCIFCSLRSVSYNRAVLPICSLPWQYKKGIFFIVTRHCTTTWSCWIGYSKGPKGLIIVCRFLLFFFSHLPFIFFPKMRTPKGNKG